MSWSRIVWMEGDKEYEDVLPTSWVDEGKDVVRWPKKREQNCKNTNG